MMWSLIPACTPMSCGRCGSPIPADENYVRFDREEDGREVKCRWCVACFKAEVKE